MGELINLNSRVITDSDIPEAIARDAEVTNLIATHTASSSPHGAQNFLPSTRAAGLSYGFIQSINPIRNCGLEVQSANSESAAFMSFHRPGIFGFHLGISVGDNQFKLGGWSLGEVTYRIWHEAYGVPVWQTPSDKALKENIRPIPSALQLILECKPVSFRYNKAIRSKKDFFGDNFQRDKIHYGFLADEVPLQDLVGKRENGYLGLDYVEFIPFLCRAIQEQQELIEALTKRLDLADAKPPS